jgi:hypothetical protein
MNFLFQINVFIASDREFVIEINQIFSHEDF